MGAGSARPLLHAMFDRIYNLTVPGDTNKEKKILPRLYEFSQRTTEPRSVLQTDKSKSDNL